MMQSGRGNLFTRDDTFFGVCEGLGEDLGINANLLRIAASLALFWNPVAVIAGYFAAGVLVLGTRLIFPNPRPSRAVEAPAVVSETPIRAEPARELDRLPQAA